MAVNIQKYASSNGWSYWETSAKDGVNCNKVFAAMVQELLITSEYVVENLFPELTEDKLYICDLAKSWKKLESLMNVFEQYKNEGSGLVTIKLLDDLKRQKICLRIDLKQDMIEDEEKVGSIQRVFKFLSPYVESMIITNCGTGDGM